METITSFIDGGGNVLVAASSDIGQFVFKELFLIYHCRKILMLGERFYILLLLHR